MRFFCVGAAVVSLFIMGPEGFAGEDGGKAKFRLAHNVTTYKTSTVEQKPDSGSKTKYSESSLDMFAGGWEFYVTKDVYNLYVYPGQQGSSVLGGYSVTPSLELGLSLNLSSFSGNKAVGDDLPKTSSSMNLYGGYATYYLSIGDKSVFEIGLNPVFGTRTAKSTDSKGVESKEDTSLTQLNASILFDYQCLTNLHYYASVVYTAQAEKDGEAHTKTTTNTTSMTPIGLRYYL